ncbi:MAG TPA: hypothetical protein VF168_10000 [Trueperaceae bacterium]
MDTNIDRFLASHDHYLADIRKVYSGGDVADYLAWLLPGFSGSFARAGMDRSEPYDIGGSIEGMTESAASIPGLRSEIIGREARRSSGNEILVRYEKRIYSYDEPVSFAMVVESWRQVNGSWRLNRESIEVGRPV